MCALEVSISISVTHVLVKYQSKSDEEQEEHFIHTFSWLVFHYSTP